MANDKQYRITVGGESLLWDADKYERNKDGLTSSYPDAKVDEMGYVSANEEQVIPGEKYRVTIGDEQQEWDSDKLNRNKGHLLRQYPDAKIERLGVISSQNQPEQNDNVETNFFKGLHQMNKNIWQAGLWHSLRGEIANLFTGSSREEQAALNDIEYLESVGIDPREYLANVEDAEFQKLYGMNREQFDALDKSERKRLSKDAASRQGELSKDAIKALEKERKQRQSVIDAYQDALAEAGGDLDKAKEILRAKAEDKTWGDEQIEKANAIYEENKELQGAAKWGGLAASAIPSAAALGLSFLTKGKTAGISKWLNRAAKAAGNIGMAGMSAGTAGMSMIEARQHGATNWETWTTGIADGLIEFITEKIPFDKLTKPVLSAAKTRTTKALMDAMRRVDSPGRKELEKLLTEANKKLGGKLLKGKNVADWLANAATEAVSEATAEALQTVTSMIYLNPEEYPTFSEIALNAWEGAKGGFALGGVLGGAGKAVEHSLHKDRRKQQGFVNVALVEQEGKNPFVAELVDYDPETNTYKALQDGEIVDVKEDEIQYKHQYTYNEFESGRYRQLEDEAIADGTVSDAQVTVSADRLGNARQKLENLMTEAGMTDEQKNSIFADLEAGDIPGFPADAKALWDAADEYSEAFVRDKDIQSARNVKAENERKSVLDAMTQQMGGEFWQKGSRTMQENGMEIIEPAMVEVGTMQDGKQVFILSTPNENGEVSAITEDGKKMFIRNTDLQGGTTIMPLQEYLDAKVSEQKKSAEQVRMAEEAAPQLDAIRQKYQMGAQVNLGTEESPTPGQIVGIKPENDGVFIQTEAGVVPYTYEQLAEIEGTPIRVMTDAQMAAAEAAEIEAADAARKTELAETPEQMTEAETVGDNAVQMENMATEIPMPLNSDGSVNQDALFKESPARWAEWNDERKQDGGASSAQYISGKLAKAQARLAELQTDYAVEDSLNKKELLEKAVMEQRNVVDELAGVMQKYASQSAQQPAQQAPIQQERSVESVLASLYDGTLTDEEIRANIEANLAEAQKAYDKYVKKTPKMGTDKDAYLAEKEKYEQGIPALQKEIDFWNGVKQTYENAMQQEIIPTEESFRAELSEEDMEPHTPAELAAQELGSGRIKLLRDSFMAHTGYGKEEASKLFGLFRTKERGGLTIEGAGDMLMEIDAQNAEQGMGVLDQNDPMAGVNAILDALGDAQTIGDLRNYIARNREAQVAREAAAAYSAMNADYEANYGMTMEESAHADHVANLELMQGKALSETQNNELNSIFAEEVYQNGTNEYQSETGAVSGSEETGSQPIAVGGTEGVHQDSNQVLLETQSPIGGGETVSAGQTNEDVSESNEQDGDTSIHAGEQSTEVGQTPLRSKEDAEYAVNPLAMTHETMLKIMAETREAIHERVNTWSDKLGIKINIIDNYRDVENKDAKANIRKGNLTYGWFERSTGEIFIYVPDYLNYRTETALKEVEKTILHEGIAHKGMLEMLGEEKYGELCDKVWNEVMTDKQKKEFIKYPGVNGNTRAAADEFIASVSENVKQDTVWDKIANFFKGILNSIGIETKVADDDLKGLLKQSYQRYRKGEANTNPGSNQQAEGNTSLRSANGSLVGMHNISEDKLRKVLKQGGLANPSTAVVNIAEYLLDGYGDISLIMPSSLVDANTGDNIGTYTGDAWTPTYPPISRKVDDKGWKVIKDLIRSVVSEDSPLYHDIINGLENYLEDNRSSKMEFVFLKKKGIEPEIAYKGADGFVGMRNLEAVLGVQGLRDGLESYERYKNASPMAKRSFNMWLDAAGNKQAHKELKEQIKKEPKLAEVLKLNEDVSFAEFDSFTYDIFRKEQDAGKIDTYDTMGAAARYVDANNLRGEFEAWLESLMEQAEAKEVFFAGYTRDGDRIYKDNTLENVSRYMRLQGRTNAYDDHGLSATKSALLQRLTSLSQIRKNKARLQNESAYNKEYDALKDRLWSIISQLADMQEISSNQFMNVDYAESRLQESFTKKNPIAHLNKEYGYDIDPAGEYADELNSFIKDVQQMPAKYFETKFERPVYLNEFAAAVMPTTTSEDIKQAVSEAGLPIFEYDSAVEGSRKEATLKATEGEGIRFRTHGEKGAANLDKAEETTIRLDNLGVARQMEEAGKDAKAIKLATGWERGADNLWRYEVADDFDLAELENRLQENLNDGLSKTWGVLYPSDLGDLTKAYPDFNVDIMVWVGDEFDNTGEYSPATEGDETTFGRSASIEVKAKTVADIKDVLVHEIQHAIQEKEGFAEGGSVFGLKDKLSAELDKRVARIKELRAEGRDAEADELMRMSKGLAEAVINNDADTYQNYRKLAGEVEARNVSARLGMSEQERRESLLSETEDVAREDQIVLMDGLGVSEMGTNMLRTRITPEQDAAYLKAVEAGDMEAAQRMVNEAAKLAMPNTKVVDEDGNPKVVYHGTGSEFYTFRKTNDINELGAGYYFSDSYEMAERYATDETLPDNKQRVEDLAFEIFVDEMGHTEEEYEYENEETEEDYHEAFAQATKRLFEKGHVKSVFLNIENPFVVGSRSEDLPYRSLWQQTDEAHRLNDGIIDPEFTLRHETLSGNQYVAFKPSQIKSADPVTYDDNGNVIPLSERFNEEKSDIRFKTRTDSQREKLFADAKERFGVTDNFKVAGYMLPDGSLLDFSEANDGGDPNQRSLDHRSIEDVIMEDGTEYDSRWMYLADFMNEGAIRLLPEYAGINLMKAPTKEQRQRLMDFIYKYNGEVILEIADERLNNAAYVEYDRRTSPARIFRDIDGYFNEGIVPQSNTMFKTANNNQAIFVSNAAKAVEGIKMEKATPEQWLKMIEKNGGLKAGEDKWMGLSDWLKASDKKTLTKQEVLDFVNEHMIQIEEQHYGINAEDDAEGAHGEISERLQDKFDNYVDEYYQDHDWEDGETDNAREYAIERLREEMGDTFPYTIELEHGSVYLTFPYEEEDDLVKWAEKTGVKYTSGVSPINDTRLNYTTDGLENKHEIALTVPTIERWGQHDDIHFGDAGDGRAVAWVRFGDTEVYDVVDRSQEIEKAKAEYLDYTDNLKEKYNIVGYGMGTLDEKASSEEKETYDAMFRRIKDLQKEHGSKISVNKKVLVIDEIQSKRHQEGREKGYAAITTEQFIARMNDKYGTKYYGWQDKATPEELDEYRSFLNTIPDAPFDKNWHELAMKRMLRYAAENGYDVVAWTKGDQQAKRYNLAKSIDNISRKDGEGFNGRRFFLKGYNANIRLIVNDEGIVTYASNSNESGKPLSEFVGKELAVKMMSLDNESSLEGEEIVIGGEGMKGFYDRMLPAFMNKYGKKWGVKVEDIHLNLEGGLNMHSVPVTEEMKSSVMEGQVMFKTKHPLDSTKLFMQEVTNEFYDKYGTSAPASVVYAKSRKMVAEALGFNADTLPDWVYEKVKEEAKVSAAFLANMNIGHSDGTIENRKRILIFAKEGYNMSADVDRIIFHENIHGFVLENPELLKLGEWLSESDNKTVKRVIGWIKDAYEKDEWANEMVSDYAARMLSIGKGQMALNLIPDEYKPLLNYIYEKFGYRPEQEDGRRVAELISDAETLQMRDSKLEGADRGSNLFRTEISPEIRREMDVISAQAIVSGTYLKAPNGADTNLTPDQWAMVRTKAFKAWFGEWENDPENASKVVDENGEPMVVYHGTRQGNFTVFDTTKANKERDYTYDGIHYFTESETTANTYGDTKAAFLNIRNPYEYDFEGRSWRNDDWSGIGIMHRRSSEIIKEGFSSVEEAEKYLAHFLEEHPEYKDEEGYGAEVVTGMYVGSKGDHTDELANKARAQGYDGTVFNNVIDYEMYDEAQRDELLTPHKSFTVFSPNQIKSATDNTGEFSESEDIRFKTTGTPTEQVVKDGLILSIEDFTNLAGNIFSAMPEDVRRKVVENAARTDYDLKKATLQMSASLAEKRELTDEEIELAKMVAQKVEDAVLASGVEMTRPFTTNEALWMLYQSTNPTSEYDLIGNARKAVVANNLGMSQSQQAEQEKDADNIRFRSARGAAANSAAAMYNNEQRSAWGMLRETYQDMYRSVKNLVQAIEKTTGKDAQSWENILTSLNALSSKNLADKKKYLRDFLTPMWDAALAIRDKYNKSLEQIERYLMVKHGLERNKVLAARDARNFYREQADQEIAAIKADKSLSKAEQKTRIQKVEDTYDNHVSDIEAGIDAKFQEFRAKDYGGLTALFSDFADYGTREDYESEELYQEAALAARTPKFATLAETEIEAQKEVDAFEKEVDKTLIDNFWKKINAATKETLRHQYANNMLTKEQYERVRDMFEFYVPLRGFVDTTAEDTYSYYVSGQQSKFANPLQGAKGRKTQAETPLGWIGSMAESAIQMDNKNSAKLALYYFAVNRPNNDVLKITPTWYEWTGEVDADGKKIFEPVYPTFDGPQSGPAMQAQMDAFESMMEEQAQAGNAYKGRQRIDLKEAVIRAPKSAPEHVVSVKVAGEDYSIIINANPRAAQAINGMLNIDKGDNPLYRAARAILRFQASIKTSLAPLFWITNFMRDVSFAFINTSIRYNAGYTKEFAKNYPHAFRVFSYVHKNRKAALGDSKYEKYYTEFAENGGITGYTSLTNNTEYDQMMKAYAKNARAGKFIKGIRGALEVYQDLGESFEQVSRFAAYITARESGKDISESIYEAKEVTINFNRKGSGKAITWEESGKMRRKNGKPVTDAERIFFVTLGGLSPVARSLFMFFNAGMQGVRMIAKLAHEHPGKSAAWAGIVFTMGLINAIIHALAEDDDEYLDMPDYVRRTNILIGKNGTYFKWSLPHEVRPFYAMADIFVQHAMGRKPNKNIAAELAETFGEWVPINPFKDGMNAFTPDIIRPFVEIKNNKDFTGSPIYREYRWLTEDQQKNMPAYEKGFDSTSKVLVDISEILNDVSGGDHTDAGFININPAIVEHLAQEYGGGPLKLAEQFFKTIGVMTGDQEFSIRNTPFLSTFMVAADDRYRNAHTTELFKYYKGMAEDVKRRAGEYKADKDKEGFDKLRASDDFQIFQIYRKYEKRDKFYNEQLKRAKSDSERKDIMSLQDAHRKRMIEELSNLLLWQR